MDYFTWLLCAWTLIICGFLGRANGCFEEGGKCMGQSSQFDPNNIQESCRKLTESLSCINRVLPKCNSDERKSLESGLAGVQQTLQLYCGTDCSLVTVTKCLPAEMMGPQGQQGPHGSQGPQGNMSIAEMCQKTRATAKCLAELRPSCKDATVLSTIDMYTQAMNEQSKACGSLPTESSGKKGGASPTESSGKKESSVKKEVGAKKGTGDATMSRVSILVVTFLPLVSLLWV